MQMGSDIIGTLFDSAGKSVALSGDGKCLAVGSPLHSPGATESTGPGSQGPLYGSGRVSVYYWDTAVSEWSLLDDHIMSHSAINMAAGCTGFCGDLDKFGWVVSLSYDGSTLAIGARGTSCGSGCGAAYVKVYKLHPGTLVWHALAGISDPGATMLPFVHNTDANIAVSPDGNRVAVITGDLRIFDIVSGGWSQYGGSDLSGGGGGGHSTSISQDGSIVSFAGGDRFYCWLKVFRYDGDGWGQMGATIREQNSDFSCSIRTSLSNDGLSIVVRLAWQDTNGMVVISPQP